MITQSQLKSSLEYNPDSGKFHWRFARGPIRAGQRAGREKSDGYRYLQISGKEYPEHWLAWLYIHNEWPAETVDHKNLQKDDNRISNLRLATFAQQQHNAPLSSRNKHGSKGIKWRSDCKKWRVEIYVDGKAVNVGHYPTKELATIAYRNAAHRYFGEFARA